MKIAVISIIFVLTLFIPDNFFVFFKQEGFREFSRYLSIIYLVLQMCVILDISYAWNDSWIESYENSNGTNYKHMMLFFFSGIFWVIALVSTVLNFYWFSKDTGCELEVFLISFTLALGVTYTFVSLTNLVEYGCNINLALLTSSTLNLYCVYLCWSGMMNDSNSHCNTWNTASDTIIGIFGGIGMLGVNLAYVCFWKRESVPNQSFLRAISGSLLVKHIPDEDLYNDQDSGRNLFFFHLYMALISTYMSMILTNWGSANVTNDPKKTYQK